MSACGFKTHAQNASSRDRESCDSEQEKRRVEEVVSHANKHRFLSRTRGSKKSSLWRFSRTFQRLIKPFPCGSCESHGESGGTFARSLLLFLFVIVRAREDFIPVWTQDTGHGLETSPPGQTSSLQHGPGRVRLRLDPRGRCARDELPAPCATALSRVPGCCVRLSSGPGSARSCCHTTSLHQHLHHRPALGGGGGGVSGLQSRRAGG